MSDLRRGTGLVESLVALLLTTGLLILIGTLLVHHRRTAATLSARMEGVEAARVARDLISTAVTADPEARVMDGELLVRSFVGFARRCGEEGWAYRGRRLPDPDRDSLWAVMSSGRVGLAKLEGRAEGRCPVDYDARILELASDPPLPSEVRLIRVFEAGRYRLDDAVRYGRVGLGAQPLSASVLDADGSRLASSGAGVTVSVLPEGRARGYDGIWRP